MQVILSDQALEFISLSKNSRNEKKNKCIKERLNDIPESLRKDYHLSSVALQTY